MQITKHMIKKINRLLIRLSFLFFPLSKDLTIISSNCIGGRLYRLLNIPYASPTVGLWFRYDHFCEFCNNLEDYLSVPPAHDIELSDKYGYPVGDINGIKIMFQHYESFDDAFKKWSYRCSRVNLSRVLVLCTDRDGFTNEQFFKFTSIKFKKLFFTCRNDLFHSDAIFLSRFRGLEQVGDLYTSYEYLNMKKIKIGIKKRIKDLG